MTATEMKEARKSPAMVKIDLIDTVADIQVRVHMDEDAIEEYTKLLLDGGELDPIIVIDGEEGRCIISDGHQRYEAYRRAERLKVPCNTLDGNLSDALENAINRNAHHGTKMTREDKRRSVKLALADARMRRYSDSRLARLCGVSPTFVAKIREGKVPRDASPRKKKCEVDNEQPVDLRTDTPSQNSDGPASNPASSGKGMGPSAVPATAREREAVPTRIETIDERVKTVKQWVKEGFLDHQTLTGVLNETEKKLLFLTIPREGCTVKVFDGKEFRMELVPEEPPYVKNGSIEVVLDPDLQEGDLEEL